MGATVQDPRVSRTAVNRYLVDVDGDEHVVNSPDMSTWWAGPNFGSRSYAARGVSVTDAAWWGYTRLGPYTSPEAAVADLLSGAR